MGLRKRFAPGSFASAMRMRAATVSIGSRSPSGFNEMNICPVLRCPKPPEPVNAVTWSTAGSRITMAT